MASTVLPNGIIIPEKYSRDWYSDLYHNWQELDNLLAGGGGGANDGTLTIQKNGSTVGTFSANQATDETINIEVPDVNNGTLTIRLNGTDVQTFTANQSGDVTADIVTPPVNDGTLTIMVDGITAGTFTANQSTDTIVALTSGGGGGANDGTLTIQKNGDTVGTFSANQATDETINITVPDVNDATLTIQQNGTIVDTFTANSSSDKTVNIQCVDLANNQTVGGIKTFSNAPVVGSINLDGKTIDTDANGNMTYDSHIVETIEEQGEGYIRYTSGIQICWGGFGGIPTTPKTITFQKPFVARGIASVTFAGQNGPIVTQSTGLNPAYFLVNASADITADRIFTWQAIGRWK